MSLMDKIKSVFAGGTSDGANDHSAHDHDAHDHDHDHDAHDHSHDPVAPPMPPADPMGVPTADPADPEQSRPA